MTSSRTGWTLNQAAKEAGKSKGTISKAIKAGKLSATRTESGSFSIDPAELFRVFPRTTTEPQEAVQEPRNEVSSGVGADTVKLAVSEAENALLREQVDDLKQRLQTSEQERREAQAKVSGLLEKVANPTPLWKRLFGNR